MTTEERSQYKRSWDSARAQKRKAECIEYLGGKCVECSSDKNLQFDHRDRSTKAFDISRAFNRSWEVLVVELNKCQLLCEDCHKNKTSREKSVEHGGGVQGKLGCKCDSCKVKKAEYMRAYRLKQKQKIKEYDRLAKEGMVAPIA
ncbi:MAG TPA: hypothetical protein VIY48_17345 [Candidatus Paceibacterota bacterium]